MSSLIVFTKRGLGRILREIKVARQVGHRRLIVLAGDNDGNLIAGAIELVREYYHKFGSREMRTLYVYHAFYEDGVARKDVFRDRLGIGLEVGYIPYHEIERILGQTYDLAVIDIINNLEPNDLGRLAGIVRGGGLYILLAPSFERFTSILTRFQSTLLTPQYRAENIRHLFQQRFLKKVVEHGGIAVYDVDHKIFKKRFTDSKVRVEKVEKKVELPRRSKIPRNVYRLAATQDQVEVLKIFEKFYERPEKGKRVIVITSDRGRGKSSVIGLGIGGLAHRLRRAKGRCRILVTAPSESNVQEVFRFASKALRSLGYSVEEDVKDGYIVGLRAKKIEVIFSQPLSCLRRSADVVAVDEAASLHVPMLFAILNHFDRIVYSSTIHGYEGAGRGFSVRFLGRLRRLRDVEVYEYEMEEPIRYSRDDPIERWIFDLLLLDAEPAALDDEDEAYIERGEVEYLAPDIERFFLWEEELLRQFIGIYIMAHYRNNPNDLGMMMDAPHHHVRALRLPTGKIVVSIEIAEEGPLTGQLAKESAKGAWIMGNIVPDRLIKHYKLIDFGGLKGIRVVRIATHPSVMRRGLGSRALRFVEEEARRSGYDWVGAGFGVTKELLGFWLKNGFVPVHLSPERNPVSGEYSLIVIKPLNERARRFVEIISWEFKRKMLESLVEPYHDINPLTARMLLKSTPRRKVSPNLSPVQIGRFMSYAWSDMTLENCMDAMRELAKVYFSSTTQAGLSDLQELLLVTRVLQAKSWKVTCNELNITPPKAMGELRASAQKLSAAYLGVDSEDAAEKYVFLSLADLECRQPR